MLCSILQFLLSDIRKVSFFCSFFRAQKSDNKNEKEKKEWKSCRKVVVLRGKFRLNTPSWEKFPLYYFFCCGCLWHCALQQMPAVSVPTSSTLLLWRIIVRVILAKNRTVRSLWLLTTWRSASSGNSFLPVRPTAITFAIQLRATTLPVATLRNRELR